VRLSQESSRLYFPLSPFHLSQRSDRSPSRDRNTDDRLSCAYFSRPCMTSDCHALQPTQRYDARDRGISPLSILDIIDNQQMSMYFFAAQVISSLFLRYSITLRSMFTLLPDPRRHTGASTVHKMFTVQFQVTESILSCLYRAQRIKELFLLKPEPLIPISSHDFAHR
jgi:hypothetical protein